VRVLVTTMPGLAGVQAMIPLSRALDAAGHDVLFATGQRHVGLARTAGLEAVPVGPDWSLEEADKFIPGFTGRTSREGMAALAASAGRGIVDDLLDVAKTWQPDVVVHSHHELGGWIAAERVGVPNVPVATTVRWLDPGLLRMMAGAEVTELLDAYGLPPDPAFERPTRWLYLDMSPRALTGAMYGTPPTVHHIRFESDDTRGIDAPLPGWIDRLGDRPLVYVTTGTLFDPSGDLLSIAAQGAARLDVEVLVTARPPKEPTRQGPLPANVHVEEYVPHTLLIPRCRAVVCHGSASNVIGALAEGIPLVLVPMAADQPVTAWLCANAGVGISCATTARPGEAFPAADPTELTPDAVAEALQTVLTTESYAAAARDMAAAIRSDPPVDHGVELIERLVASGASPDPE
jgi:UDP:flavonoid glycosyltransferase YjiC (YdhE family)